MLLTVPIEPFSNLFETDIVCGIKPTPFSGVLRPFQIDSPSVPADMRVIAERWEPRPNRPYSVSTS